jgi:hypothetical protein
VQFDPGNNASLGLRKRAYFPATVSAIADSIQWAERIMEEIDRRHPAKPMQQKSG